MSRGSSLARDRGWIAGAYVSALVVALLVGWAVSGIVSGAGAPAGGLTPPAASPHPIAVAAWADLAATLVVFGFSAALDNSSVYDPYWSVVPIALGSYWLLVASGGSAAEIRTLTILLLVVVWAVRLTANWVERWRGLEDEDWRYREIRVGTGRAYWLASLFGLHLLPTALVFLGCLPLYFVLAAGPGPMGPLDALAAGLMVAGIGLEWSADRELRRFRRGVSPGDQTPDGAARGALLTSGVWAWCRHPNYLGELLFWWGLALAGSIAAPSSLFWSVLGAVAISVLFAAVSLPMMERRLAPKPGFAEYARCTPLLLPRRPRERML